MRIRPGCRPCLVLTGPAGRKQFLVRASGPAAWTLSGARNIAGLSGGIISAQQNVSMLPRSRPAATRRAPACGRADGAERGGGRDDAVVASWDYRVITRLTVAGKYR